VSWQLELLGEPRLVLPAPAEATPATPCQQVLLIDRDAGLLAYVALAGPGPARRVAELLWPGRDDKQALNNLRQRLHKLRRSTGARLLEMGQTLSLAADLQLAAPEAAQAADRPEPPLLRRLLHPFEYLDAPEFAEWLAARRQDQAAAHGEHLLQAAARAESTGDLRLALHCAQRCLKHEPRNERPYRLLIRLHYLLGDAAQAVSTFRECERMLRDEYDIEPSAETAAQARLALAAIEAALPAVRTPPLPLALLRPPRTVGREGEVQRLLQALQLRRHCLVRGEAGMGKSRLLQELVAHEGPAVVAQARPGDMHTPYATALRLLDALAQAVPADAARDNEALQMLHGRPGDTAPAGVRDPQQALRSGLGSLLRALCQHGTGLVVVDDLHFADAASVELMVGVLGDVPASSPVWVLAQRPPALAADTADALAESGAVSIIDLHPLQGDSFERFVHSLSLVPPLGALQVQHLARHTGGNPLFALETLRELLAAPGRYREGELPVPRDVQQLIRARLSRLSPAAAALARVAALAVPDFSPELAAEVLETPALALADAWAELESAQVLSGQSFAHDLVQEAARQLTPEPIARHTHRRIASHLARVNADAARLAQHWQRAGEPQKACLQYEQAARQAARRGRLREAGELLLSAAQQAEAAGQAETGLQLRARATGHVIQSQGPEAAAPLVADMLQRAEKPAELALARIAQATMLLWSGKNAEAGALAEAALAGAGDDVSRSRATRIVAQSLRQQGRAREGLAALRPWAERVDALLDVEEQVSWWADYTSLLISTEHLNEALLAADRQSALARVAGDSQAVATGLINQCVVRASVGDLPGAVDCARQVHELLADQQQSAVLHGMNRIQLGYLLGACGHFAEALQHLDEGRLAFDAERMPWIHAVACNAQARLYAWLGQRARALQQLQVPLPGTTVAARITRLHLLAELTGLNTREAASWLAEAAGLAAEAGLVGPALISRLHQLRASPVAERARALPEMEAAAQDAGYRWLQAVLQLQRLEDLQQLGQPAQALRELPAAVELARQASGPSVYTPQTRLRLAVLARSLGQAELGHALLEEAAQWVHRAEKHCPAEFQDSFRYRNETNLLLRSERQRSP
jgi:DNA-binding SARP family transcriptional activator